MRRGAEVIERLPNIPTQLSLAIAKLAPIAAKIVFFDESDGMRD